jgi:hypothetical protein
MSVENTKGGTLTRKLREREEILSSITGYRVRFQESGGNQLANMFSTDMAKGEHCGREACLTCKETEHHPRGRSEEQGRHLLWS